MKTLRFKVLALLLAVLITIMYLPTNVLATEYNLDSNQKKIANDILSSKTVSKLEYSLLTLTGKNDSSIADEVSNIRISMQESSQYIEEGQNFDVKGRTLKADDDLVYVYIKLTTLGGIEKVKPLLHTLVSEDKENKLVAAYVEVSMLALLDASDDVDYVRAVDLPIFNAVRSEGDTLHRADIVRAMGEGYDGSGVKIGVISDGVTSYSSSISAKELPSDLKILSNKLGGDEGTAMLEIIYDLAPGAKLYFHDAGTNTIEFNQAITNLVNAGCNIIVDDVGWITEPFFEDGVVAKHIKNVINTAGIVYISSAGNAGKSHYQGRYYDSVKYPKHHDFSAGKASAQDIYINVLPGEAIQVILQWDDAFGSSGNDYDLFLLDANGGSKLASSQTYQEGSDDPFERVTYKNDTSEPQDVAINVRRFTDNSSNILELYIYASRPYTNNIIPADSIFGHAAVEEVIAVGAINASEATQIASYSSRGPVTLRGGSTRHIKPEVCGIDGVSVTGAGGFPSPFYGTSAAAPHIAAITALIWAKNPQKTNTEIRQTILTSTKDLGTAGFDNTYGYGLVDASIPFETKPIGSLETPTQGQTVNGNVYIGGWFLDSKGVSKIEVLVDGVVNGVATYGGERPDVASAYPNYKNSKCGFSYSLDTTKLSNGSHNIVIRETGATYVQTSLAARTIIVSNTLPAIGGLETPSQGQTVSGTINVGGWFLDGSGVSKIEVLVDGVVNGTATYGNARTDVGAAYPGYKNNNCGYKYALDTTKLSNGSHSLVIRETGVNGKQTSLAARTIIVSNTLPAIGGLETPSQGQTVSGTINVGGWFLDGSGVSKIEVLVDGVVNGTATYGNARTDVGAAYPGYKNSNCGYKYALDTTKLSNGSHSLVIRETGVNGNKTSLAARTIIVSNTLPAVGGLDTPSQGQTVSGTINVGGWFLDGSGVAKIEVLVDGVVNGTATYGSVRTDVGTAYPGYKNSNCGYKYALDTTKMSNGSHSLVIRETGVNGNTTNLPARTIIVSNTLPAIGGLETPSQGQTVSGTINVGGWFLDGSGVAKIEVLIDGVVNGTATYGSARTDVSTAYPGYKNSNCGYKYALDTTKLSNGSHSLVIRETGVNGNTTSLPARTIIVSNTLPAIGSLETPSQGQTVSGTINVGGWFLDGSGVAKIEVLIDGVVNGTATYGSARTDVSTAYPGYKNSNCGYKYALDTTKLSNGSHSLVIRETGVNGNTTSLPARTIIVSNTLPAIGSLETPAQGQTVNGKINVGGWFLDGSGVSKIEVLVDGTVIGTANYGSLRSDVAAVYPNYGQQNCGYWYSLDTTNLSNGSHTLVIRGTGIDSNVKSLPARTIIVSNSLPAIGSLETPSQGQTLSGNVFIGGWFLDGSGVSKIEVLIDGQVFGTATYGTARPDVGAAYPSYSNNNPGYYFMLDTKLLSNGSHTLVIRETGFNSQQKSLPAMSIIVSN